MVGVVASPGDSEVVFVEDDNGCGFDAIVFCPLCDVGCDGLGDIGNVVFVEPPLGGFAHGTVGFCVHGESCFIGHCSLLFFVSWMVNDGGVAICDEVVCDGG